MRFYNLQEERTRQRAKEKEAMKALNMSAEDICVIREMLRRDELYMQELLNEKRSVRDVTKEKLCKEDCELTQMLLRNFHIAKYREIIVDCIILCCESCKLTYDAETKQPLYYSVVMLDRDDVVVEINSLLYAITGAVDAQVIEEIKVQEEIIDYLFDAIVDYANYLRENQKEDIVERYEDKMYTVEIRGLNT